MSISSEAMAGGSQMQAAGSGYDARASLADLELAVTELFRAVDCALREEFDVAQVSVQRAAALLRVEPGPVPAATDPASGGRLADRLPRGGLAPWQTRKVRTYIEGHLGATILTRDLASLVRLSPFHFSRAFKETFGESPHRYLLRRRIEHAQGLMLSTGTSLAQIALECGLVDQAHFGRSFRRIVGETPAAWRRARVTEGT